MEQFLRWPTSKRFSWQIQLVVFENNSRCKCPVFETDLRSFERSLGLLLGGCTLFSGVSSEPEEGVTYSPV